MVLLKKVRWILPLSPILIINIWKQGGCILCNLWTWQYLQVNESLKRSCWVLSLSHFLYIFCSKITDLHSLLVNQRLRRTEFSTQLVTHLIYDQECLISITKKNPAKPKIQTKGTQHYKTCEIINRWQKMKVIDLYAREGALLRMYCGCS